MTTITECYGDRQRHRGKTLRSVIRRVWGRSAFFHQDSGIPRLGGTSYGQIFRDLGTSSSGWSATALTGRVRVDEES